MNEFFFPVRCFTLADRPHHGVRLARQHEMDSELLRLALLTSKKTMLETAEYFDEKEDCESAMMLYHKVEAHIYTRHLNCTLD